MSDPFGAGSSSSDSGQSDPISCGVNGVGPVEFDREANRYRTFFDSDLVSPSTAVASLVIALTETDQTEMDCLYRAIDSDALDKLMTDTWGPRGDIHLTFEFSGYLIKVSNYGVISVQSQ